MVTEFLPSPRGLPRRTGRRGRTGRSGPRTMTSRSDPAVVVGPLAAGAGGRAGGRRRLLRPGGGEQLGPVRRGFVRVPLGHAVGLPAGAYPRSNRLGTYFFGRSGGVWARAPDGQETTRGVQDSYFYAADDGCFAAHVGTDIVLHQADSSGRFFTTSAPAASRSSRTRRGGFVGASADIAAGDGRIVAGTCEAGDLGTCTEHSVTLLEPNPNPSTPLDIRLDRPATGLPPTPPSPTTRMAGGLRPSRRLPLQRSCTGIGGAICVRSRARTGSTTLRNARLRRRHVPPASARPGAGLDPLLRDDRPEAGRRPVAFFYGGEVVVVDAGPDGGFNTADDLETVLGTTTQAQGAFLAVAGNYVAWMTSGATGAPSPGWPTCGTARPGSSRTTTRRSTASPSTGPGGSCGRTRSSRRSRSS